MSNNKKISNIFKAYQSQLKLFISGRVPSREDGEDILQDVFYQLSRIDLEENPIQQISSWLYTVTRSKIIDKRRKQKEEEWPYYPDEEGDDALARDFTQMILDEDSSPETDFIKILVREEFDEALAELPEEQRTVFELTELQGFSVKDISESTGLSVNTILSRKRYAVLHLRKRLSVLYEELLSD